jgi:hypothetical protein
VVLLQLIILLPPVQHKLKSISVSTMQEQLNAEVSIGDFRLGFPKKLKIHDILITGKASDTLVYLGEFSVNIELLPLLQKQLIVQSAGLRNGKGDIGKLLAQIPADTTTVEPIEPASENDVPWEVGIRKLTVESCFFKYRDEEINGFELILDIGSANFKLGTLNLDELIGFKSLDISDTYVSYETLDIIIPDDDTDTSAFEFADIRVQDANLRQVEFAFIDSSSAIIFNAGGDQVDVDDLLIELTHSKVALSNGFIKNTTCAISFLPSVDTTPASDDYLNWGQYLWRVESDRLDLEDFRLTLDNIDAPDPDGHFNNDHMDIQQLSGKLSDIILDTDTLSLKITDLSGMEKNGLTIKNWNANLFHRDASFFIQNMNMETNVAQYKVDLETSISPTNYSKTNGQSFDLKLDINANNMEDIDYFYAINGPDLGLVDDFLNNGFSLTAHLSGSDKAISIKEFKLDYLDSTAIYTHGEIENINNPDMLRADLNLRQVSTGRKDMIKSLNLDLPNPLLALPDLVTITGRYQANGSSHHFVGDLNSDIGTISDIRVSANLDANANYAASMQARLQKLDKILDLGFDTMDFSLEANWNGEELYTSDAALKLMIDRINYQGNSFHDLSINGELAHGFFKSGIHSPDTNIHFNIALHGEFSIDNIDITGDFDLQKIDLYQLHLYPSPFGLSSETSIQVSYSSLEEFMISTDIRSLDFHLPDTLYNMHPAKISFNTSPANTDFHLASFFYNLDFTCQEPVAEFIHSVAHLPGYYLSDFVTDSIPFGFPEFDLQGRLEYPEAFARLFFPDYPSFTELELEGSFDPLTDQLTFNVSIPGMIYQNIKSDSLKFSARGTSDNLQYNLATNIVMDDLISGFIDLSGAFRNSMLITRLQYLDSFSNPYLDISLKLDTMGNSTVLHFIKDSLIFSYDPWEIGAENRVEINPAYVIFSGFNVSSGEQKIVISTPPLDKPQDIELELINFRMGSIEQLLALDTLVSGTANAHFNFKNIIESPGILGKLTIDEMSLYDFEAGRLNLSYFSYTVDSLNFDLALTGAHEDVQLTGHIPTGSAKKPMAIELDINQLDLSQLNYILSDYISDARGNLEGYLKMAGSIDSPELNGKIQFSDAGTDIIALSNSFTLGNEPIEISNNIIQFNNFSIRNKKDQKAKIIGSLALHPQGNIYHNLHIITDNMEIMNATQKDNDMLFGLLKAQTDIEIEGLSNAVNVSANVRIDKESNVTYIFPDELALDDNEGIVEFNRFEPETLTDENAEEAGSFLGMQMLKNFKSRIEIEEGSTFNLFFDSGGKDFLKASMDGFINYTVVENNSEISGMFGIMSGTLHYAVPMVTVEEYTLEPGSSITLSNDVYNPYLKIVASSEVRASTEGLMSSNPKVMMFKILLYMEGELNDLQLRFDISQETSDALVSSRLAQLTEEERNINALNLLVRGSFLISLQGDELGSTTTANAQIDKFYATHLNHLISENISFVDLKFDVQSFKDYNTSGDAVLRRNYYYNIGKSFLDDRARINYKGSLGITSDPNEEQVNSHFVQNELEIELKITKDGTYKGVFFRKNKYEGLLEGEVIETGGGIRFSKEYYSPGDMFTNDKRQERKAAKSKDAPQE